MECLVDEPDLTLLQVAQTAVDQLAALRRCSRAQIIFLDQQAAQTTCCGIDRDAESRDAAANDDDVEVTAVGAGDVRSSLVH